MPHSLQVAVALFAAAVASAEPGITSTIAPIGAEGGARVAEPDAAADGRSRRLHKSERRLYLMKHGAVLRSYRVALGLEPAGHQAARRATSGRPRAATS